MKNLPPYFIKALIHICVTSFVIFGSLNYGLAVMDYNLIEIINNKLNNYFNKISHFNTIISTIIALSAIYLMFQVTTWLPFLGPCAFPSKGLIPNKVNAQGSKIVNVKVKPNTRVAYWASVPVLGKDVPDVEDAYSNFTNSGVVTSDSNGMAALSIAPGTSYKVPSNKEIKKHLHYRELDLDFGIMGKLQTVYY